MEPPDNLIWLEKLMKNSIVKVTREKGNTNSIKLERGVRENMAQEGMICNKQKTKKEMEYKIKDRRRKKKDRVKWKKIIKLTGNRHNNF